MKHKKKWSIGLLVAILFAFTACSGATGQLDAAAVAGENTVLEDKVVIYSTHGEAMLELAAVEFEKETGVAVEYINLKGELADRVRAEKENPQADIMYGGASSIFMELKDEGLYEPYEPSWAKEVAPLFKDAEHHWFGTIQTPVMIFYNADVIAKDDAPLDWADLTNARYKEQLVFRNALSSSARATFSSLLQQFERSNEFEAGWAFMKDLDANTKQYYSSGALMFQAIGRKEAGISFATLNSIIDNKIKNNIPLEVVDAKSGSPVITDGIAMIKNAKHPNAAKAFMEFAGSAEFQAMLANEFNRMPTHPDAIQRSPEWMGEIQFKVMEVDWAKLSASQSEWMQKWDAEIKNAKKDAQ
jgi:iron(III) transport system substrate-binding protein